MKNRYSRYLKVSTPEGEKISANIFRFGDRVQIEIRKLEVVKKNDPPFAHDGIITYRCSVDKYREALNLLTRYLEDLFLKGMADEDIYSSLGAKPKSRGNAGKNLKRKITGIEGTRDSTSVHARTRRTKPAESSGGRKPDTEVAESGDKATGGEDSERD